MPMDDSERKDENRPHRISEALNEAADACGRLQRKHTQEAQKLGFASDTLRYAAGTFRGVPDTPSFAETESTVKNFRDFVENQERKWSPPTVDISLGAFTTAVSTSSDVGTVVAFSGLGTGSAKVRLPAPPPWYGLSQVEHCAARLARLAPRLRKLLRGAWQTFNSGTAEGERGALAIMRQLLDEFLVIIAPDDEVRNSRFWTPKDASEVNKIHKRERIKYAANTRIEDPIVADALDAQATQMLRTHKEFNRLHKRGELDRDSTRSALVAAQAHVTQWLDALGL